MSPRNLLRRFLSGQCRRSGPASVPTRAQVPRPPLPARRLRLCGRRPLGWLQVALRPAVGAAACRWRPAAGCALWVPRALGAQVPGPATCERRPPGPQHAVRSRRADVHAGRVGGDRRRRPRSRADASGTRGGRWVRGWPSRSPRVPAAADCSPRMSEGSRTASGTCSSILATNPDQCPRNFIVLYREENVGKELSI